MRLYLNYVKGLEPNLTFEANLIIQKLDIYLFKNVLILIFSQNLDCFNSKLMKLGTIICSDKWMIEMQLERL